ncbi:MAG TPA: hypothetical protein VMF35_03980 [Acidimicrobiales bacterium]|nr:hypothetical protein [Acidimicrobiales bacterium]
MATDPTDEGLHPAGDDENWQESAYLAWRDPRSGFGGNHRLGNELNRGTANLWCGVYHESGIRFRGNGEAIPLRRLDQMGVAAGSQRLFHDGNTLRFVLDGDECRLDLEIEDEGDRHYANAQTFSGTAGVAGTIFSNNFHVFCRVRGRVELDGMSADVDAPAWRDHSWGARRWDSFVSSRSFGAAHGDRRYRFASMVGVNGSFFRIGSVSEGGETLPVAQASMLVQVDDDSIRCPSAEVRYTLESGEVITVRIDTIGGMVGVTGQRFGWESVGDVTVGGKAGGWGFLETNLNPRNGQNPPVFVLADALTNGVVRVET